MIRLSLSSGRDVFLAAENISSIRETEASSQWHGIRAVVKTFDGQALEVGDTAKEIAAKVDAELLSKKS